MDNQLTTINIFDTNEIEKQIEFSNSVDKCLNNEIEKTQNRLDHLLEKKRNLKTVRTKIINFNEVLKML